MLERQGKLEMIRNTSHLRTGGWGVGAISIYGLFAAPNELWFKVALNSFQHNILFTIISKMSKNERKINSITC